MNFDNVVTISRFVTKTIVSSGAAAIVTNAVKATTPADITKLKKLSVAVGTMAISGLVAEHASKRVMKAFDDTVATIKDVITPEDPDIVEGTVVDD